MRLKTPKLTSELAEALTASEAPETVAAPQVAAVRARPQGFPGLTLGDVNREVICHGGGACDGTWLVPAPLPQELTGNGSTYDLADRAEGRYTWRHR
jgi:hypothetical protein